MIKFKIEGSEYYLEDFMSIDLYTKIYKLKSVFTEEYFAAKLINAISNAPIEDLLECPFEDITFLAASVLKNIPKEEDIKFQDRFTLDGIDYGFIPDWKEMTFAEFIDLDTLSTKKENEILDVLHIIAAIMYRPITEEISKHNFKIEKYDMESMKIRSELFKNKLDIKVVLGAQFFFIKFVNKYLNYTPPFSVRLTMWQKLKMIWLMWRMIYTARSKNHSDGFWSSTKSLTTILQNTSTYTKKD